MTRRPRHALCLAATALLGLAGCSSMIDSVPVGAIAPAEGPARTIGCTSALGSYNLPKSMLRLTLDGAPRGYQVTTIGTVPVADRRTFCLAYLGSITSEDQLIVKKTDNGLLERIATKADDKSAVIAQILINSVRLGAVGGRGGTRGATAGRNPPPEMVFDPFDTAEFAVRHAQLRNFGLCVVVEGVHVPEGGQEAAQFCASGRPAGLMPSVELALTAPIAAGADTRGILYRPNMSYMVSVLRKADPGSREAWSLQARESVEMPNGSPVLSVGIDRSLFSKRESILDFDYGVLTNVSVKKDAELLALANITLSAAQAGVSVISQIFALRIDIANGTKTLIQENAALIQAQDAYRKSLDGLIAARAAQNTPQPPQGTVPSGDTQRSTAFVSAERARFVQECLDTGRREDDCARLWNQGL